MLTHSQILQTRLWPVLRAKEAPQQLLCLLAGVDVELFERGFQQAVCTPYGVRTAEARLKRHDALVDLLGIPVEGSGTFENGQAALCFPCLIEAGEVNERFDGLAVERFPLRLDPLIRLLIRHLRDQMALIRVRGLLQQCRSVRSSSARDARCNAVWNLSRSKTRPRL
jgi:hypothetical protein